MTKEDCISKASGALQHKIWKPGRLKSTVKYEHSTAYGQMQNKVWDPGRTRTRTHMTRRSLSFPLWESDAGASVFIQIST